MKILISIPLIILLFFSGVSVKFATHYCHGNVAATQISFSGELATCGMEELKDICSSQETFGMHCCEDVRSSYSISNIYIPSTFTIEAPIVQDIKNFAIPADYHNAQFASDFNHTRIIRPPGTFQIDCLDPQVLCVFRI